MAETKAYISKIQLGAAGNEYYIKDEEARARIEQLTSATVFMGVTEDELEDGSSKATLSDLGKAEKGWIVVYNKAEFIFDGKNWIEFGDLSNLGNLAVKNVTDLKVNPSFTKDKVLGENTTFTASIPQVTIGASTTKNVLGANTNFTVSGGAVTTKGYKVTATGTALDTSKSSFVTSYPGATSKLVTATVKGVTNISEVSIPNVTNVGLLPELTTTVAGETLTIAFNAGAVPTLGSVIKASAVTASDTTVATGALSASGTGSEVLTGLGTPVTSDALTAASVKTQPTIAFAEDSAAPTISVVTGVGEFTVAADSTDRIAAVTQVGAATATAPTITVGTEDRVDAVTNVTATVSY